MHGIEYLNQPGYKGESWNVLYGCDGCELSRPKDNSTRCWAELQMPRQRQNTPETDTVIHGGKWTGSVHIMPARLSIPLHHRDPRFYAVQFMGDLFANAVPLEYIAAVQGVAAATPHHRYISLTKSVKRLEAYGQWIATHIWVDCMAKWLEKGGYTSGFSTNGLMFEKVPPFPNWIQGISATCQKTLEHRWPYLARFPARWRVISLTPKEPIDLRPLAGEVKPDLIILDCAAGPNAWPTDLAWIRDIIRQCREFGIGVRVKQVGSRPVLIYPDNKLGCGTIEWRGSGGRWEGHPKNTAGGDPSEWPEDICVRDWLKGF